MGNTTEHIAEEVRARNPLEQVPVLEFTDECSGATQTLTQSLAIIEFLEEAYPGTHRVLPTCALQRARARQVRRLFCYLNFIDFVCRNFLSVVPDFCFSYYYL